MSLINQMLQDLDARRAASGPQSGVPNEVRPLPVVPRSHKPLIVGLGAVLVLLAGGFFWQQTQQAVPRSELASPVMQPPAAVPLPPPEVAVAPALLPPLAMSADASAPAAVPAEEDAAGLRLASSLRLLPEREAAPAPRTTAASPSKAVTPPAVPQPVPPATASVVATAAPPAPRAAAPMLIEKSAATGTPHERAEGEYRKALAVLNAGRLSEAIDGLRAALRQEGTHGASRQLLFKLLVENKRLDEAAEALNEGLQLQPAQISWAMSLGRLQVDRGDLSGAWQTLQRSLPFAAGSADYQGFAGHVLQRLGRGREAVERYQWATRLAPAEGRWWLGLGLVLDADGQAAEARDALLRARASGTLSAELIALVDQKLR